MKKKIDYLLSGLGVILAILGVYLLNATSTPNEFMSILSYLCIGVGCGMFGHGIGNIIAKSLMRKHPEIEKQRSIEQADERNQLIGYRAKAKAYDFMTYLFATIMLVFALLQIELSAILLLVFAYLLVHGYAIYYRIRYEKEM